jgi:hypothetical protein
MPKQSQEFKERSELQRRDVEFAKVKHKLKMEQLQFERETQRIFHENLMQRERIKRAESRKDFHMGLKTPQGVFS